jgi:hypothetical protein
LGFDVLPGGHRCAHPVADGGRDVTVRAAPRVTSDEETWNLRLAIVAYGEPFREPRAHLWEVLDSA